MCCLSVCLSVLHARTHTHRCALLHKGTSPGDPGAGAAGAQGSRQCPQCQGGVPAPPGAGKLLEGGEEEGKRGAEGGYACVCFPGSPSRDEVALSGH